MRPEGQVSVAGRWGRDREPKGVRSEPGLWAGSGAGGGAHAAGAAEQVGKHPPHPARRTRGGGGRSEETVASPGHPAGGARERRQDAQGRDLAAAQAGSSGVSSGPQQQRRTGSRGRGTGHQGACAKARGGV